MFESAKGIGVRPLMTKKLEWLKNLIEKLIKMDRQNELTPISVYDASYAIGGMLDNIGLGKLPQKKQLIQCNKILKGLKDLYGFEIDWRGDIVGCDKYTEYILNR
jgi:hypothetical protein